MQPKLVILLLAICTFALASAASLNSKFYEASARSSSEEAEEDQDTSVAESNVLGVFSALPPPATNARIGTSYLDTLPINSYQAPRQNFYGGFVAPQASVGVSVNTKPLLAPQYEILRLIEAFINLKGEVLARLQALINDNYDLIRSVLNLVLGKLTSLNSFSLKGISALRQILEFALTVFADWSITLPGVTLGGSTYGAPAQPHATYGVPSGVSAPIASISAGFGK